MDDINVLVAIAIFMAGIFAMAGLRLWYITHSDVNMARKVNGLSIEVGKLKKAVRSRYEPVVGQTNITQASTELANTTQDLTLDQFVEAMGFDKKELNNPIVRPIAQQMFDAMKAKVSATDENGEASANIEML